MRKFSISVATLMFSCAIASSVWAFRCGDGNRYRAYEGMNQDEITQDCGPPAKKATVGYTEKHGSHKIAEEWLYIINDGRNDQLYVIRFDRNGRAVRIEWLGHKD